MSATETDPKLLRNDDFFSVEVESDTLLYRPTSQRAVHLDAVAAVIWKMCDGTRGVADVAEELSVLYPGEEDSVREDVRATIDRLLENEVLKLAEPGA